MEEIKKDIVLICENDASFSSLMGDYLRSKGFDVVLVPSAQMALEKLSSMSVDICLVESQMPEVSGDELVHEMRERGYWMPIVLMSDRSAREDVLAGFATGADDYVVKPFVMDILVCRIQAMLRMVHAKGDNDETVFDLGGLTFDSNRQLLGKKRLSTRENELMLMLSRSLNKMVDRSHILKRIWKSDDYFSARSLSVYVHHLRKFLETEAQGIRIVAVHGKGYKMVDAIDEPAPARARKKKEKK